MTSLSDILVTLPDMKNDQVNALIAQFVNAMYGQNQSCDYYATHRNTTIEKASADCFVGKKAEFFVWYYLIKQLNYPKIALDLEVRNGASKGWNIDLPFKDVDASFPNIHVKACQSWMKDFAGDYSWTFQLGNASGSGGRDSIFDGPDSDMVALVHIDAALKKEGTIKAMVPWGDIRSKLRDPIKPSLKGLKKCLYYQDILL